jgi:hypothetical protein
MRRGAALLILKESFPNQNGLNAVTASFSTEINASSSFWMEVSSSSSAGWYQYAVARVDSGQKPAERGAT